TAASLVGVAACASEGLHLVADIFCKTVQKAIGATQYVVDSQSLNNFYKYLERPTFSDRIERIVSQALGTLVSAFGILQVIRERWVLSQHASLGNSRPPLKPTDKAKGTTTSSTTAASVGAPVHPSAAESSTTTPHLHSSPAKPLVAEPSTASSTTPPEIPVAGGSTTTPDQPPSSAKPFVAEPSTTSPTTAPENSITGDPIAAPLVRNVGFSASVASPSVTPPPAPTAGKQPTTSTTASPAPSANGVARALTALHNFFGASTPATPPVAKGSADSSTAKDQSAKIPPPPPPPPPFPPSLTSEPGPNTPSQHLVSPAAKKDTSRSDASSEKRTNMKESFRIVGGVKRKQFTFEMLPKTDAEKKQDSRRKAIGTAKATDIKFVAARDCFYVKNCKKVTIHDLEKNGLQVHHANRQLTLDVLIQQLLHALPEKDYKFEIKTKDHPDNDFLVTIKKVADGTVQEVELKFLEDCKDEEKSDSEVVESKPPKTRQSIVGESDDTEDFTDSEDDESVQSVVGES
ncbi:MAG TPA: hypothetical protein VMR37_06165, partial [Rhabdochlamydiaceae bacterium]|nr:hypothetical protein [Rhabdochlamydiaceae bacterium]